MSHYKHGRVKAFFSFFKGDFEEMHTVLTDKKGNMKDGHPLPSKLIKFRITGPDQSANSITYHGDGKSAKILIDKESAKMVDDSTGKLHHVNGPVLRGYDDITKKNMLVIYCLEN